METKAKINTDGKVRRGELYPLADEYRYMRLINGEPLNIPPGEKLMAIWDGKPKRAPKRGEWYLSGAIVEAYLAPSDLDWAMHIAQLRLVRTRTLTEVVTVRELEG